MPVREWIRRQKEKLHLHDRPSQQSGDNQTDASDLSISNAIPASTTGVQVSPAPVSPAVAEPRPRPSSVIVDKSASLPEHLWDRAYDELKEDEAETALVQAYEKILSRHLRDRNPASDSDVDEENIIAQDDPGARRAQMKRLVTSGLAKIKRETRIKESLDKGVQVILSAKEIISSAIQTIPQAALAWTGVCVALEV